MGKKTITSQLEKVTAEYDKVIAENHELRATIAEKDKEIERLKSRLQSLKLLIADVM